MLTRKSPFKARPIIKKKKLSQLFEEHSTDPDQNYLFKAINGTIKLPNDQEEPAYQEEEQQNNNHYNYIPQSSSKKKAVGLFANIIKNMEETKIVNRPQPQKKKEQKKIGYQYYFNEFELKANKHKKQKESIELESNQQLIRDQQNYFTQIQLQNHKKEQIIYEQFERTHQNKRIPQVCGKPIDNFVDMNFSFDDISKQLISIKEKSDRQQSRNQQDTIIKKFLEQNSKNSFFEGQINFGNSLKQQKMAKIHSIQKNILKQSNKGALISFTKLSKQIKRTPNQLIPPFLAKKFAKNSSSKDLQPIFSLEGTKKVQSRIVGNDSKNQPSSINIDFDLDINFI